MAITVERFIERLTESGLMSAAEVAAFHDGLPPDKRPRDVQSLVTVLYRAGKLTKYQAKAVYQGKTEGLVFGQYIVLDKLGEGGMGVVLKAQHRRMDRLVAIKVLPPSAMKVAGAVERFHREVQAAARLSHPNIVTAYDAGEHQGMHYLAMEYVDGRDLATIVKEHGPLGVREAVECVLQAARGLQCAHEQGIVHRDIKPGNLLLDKRGAVKILDMGLARIAEAEVALGGAERLTNTGQVMGTCDYMAPEQSLDTHQADARADIYSLGCTLYRLLTGNAPYQGETFAKLFLMHLEAPIPSLAQSRPEVPQALDAICQRMLAKKPEDRYQSMAEVVAELESVLAVLSGLSLMGAAARAESPSEAFAASLAFLQEDPVRGGEKGTDPFCATGGGRGPGASNLRSVPRGPPEGGPRPKLAHGTQHPSPVPTDQLTQPQRGPEHDTGSNIPGEPGVAVVEVWRRPLVLAGLAGGLAVLLGLVLLLALRHGTLVVDIDEQLGRDLQVAVSRGGGKPQLLDVKSGWTLSLSAGKYDLAVEGGDDQFLLDAKSITVKRGAEVKVQVTLKPAPPAVAPFDGRQARKYQEHWARQLGVPVEITNSIGMKLVLIPPGEFMMGSPKEVVEEELKAHADDPSYAGRLPGERPWHRVRITKPFYLGTYEVTQEEYQRVIGSNPSEFSATGNGSARVGDQDTKRFPVEMVSWEQAVEFCRKLSNLPEEKSAGRRYRLPAEGQWEYACRAGNMGRFSFSSDRGGIPRESEEQKLFGYGWFNGNSGGTTHAVGEKRAGPWGLYDMHGNVWQWCRDWYDADYYAKSATDDPAGPPAGSHHVARGGSWADPAGYCRSAGRNYGEPGNRHDLGFRVSLGLADEPDGRRAEPSTEDSAPNPQVPPPTSNPPSPTPDSTSPVPPAVPVARPPSPIPSPAAAPFEAAKAKEHQAAWAEYLGLPVETTNSIGMKLVLIPPGEFMMGSPKELIAEELKTEGGWYKDSLPSEEPQHRVRITKPFYLGVTKVTQDEYQRVVGANPSYFSAKGGGKDNVRGQDTKRFPVEEVSWDEAVAFCRKLSQMPGEKAAGRTYRLPSEAQWEYACRAGSTGRFSFSSGQSGIPKEYDENALSDYGWFDGNAAGSTHAVGGKRANAWGLYDVHGNVCEWCRDWYGKDYYAGAATDDPIGPPGGTERVGRGGSWLLGARGCRSAYRTGHSPGDRRDLGLRVCQVLADN